METCKNFDGRILIWIGYILVPLSSILDRRVPHPAWNVMGGIGVLLALAGLIKEIVDIKAGER